MGSIPLVAPRAAAGMKPTQPRSQKKQLLWGPLGSHILGCYLVSEASQCSLSQTLRPAHGVLSLSCLALCRETLTGSWRRWVGENRTLSSAQDTCARRSGTSPEPAGNLTTGPYLPGAGSRASRQSYGPILLAPFLPITRMSCFPAEPKLQMGLKKKNK